MADMANPPLVSRFEMSLPTGTLREGAGPQGQQNGACGWILQMCCKRFHCFKKSLER